MILSKRTIRNTNVERNPDIRRRAEKPQASSDVKWMDNLIESHVGRRFAFPTYKIGEIAGSNIDNRKQSNSR